MDKKKLLIVIIIVLIIFSALIVVSGFNLFSEIFAKDVTLKDMGTLKDHNDIWNISNGDLTRHDDYSEFIKTNSSNSSGVLSIVIPSDSVISFQFMKVNGNNSDYFCSFYENNTYKNGFSLAHVGAEIGEWYNIEITIQSDGTEKIYCNETGKAEARVVDLNNTGNITFNLYAMLNSTDFQFKDFKVTPIN